MKKFRGFFVVFLSIAMIFSLKDFSYALKVSSSKQSLYVNGYAAQNSVYWIMVSGDKDRDIANTYWSK